MDNTLWIFIFDNWKLYRAKYHSEFQHDSGQQFNILRCFLLVMLSQFVFLLQLDDVLQQLDVPDGDVQQLLPAQLFPVPGKIS